MTQTAQRTYNDIVKRLPELNERELTAVHTIIMGLTSARDSFISPLGIRTEQQLWAHIDHSLGQSEAGILEDADVVIKELLQEFAE